MIDLHTHTTASDGCCTPDELVARAAAAGVDVLSLTDHDTVAGCRPAAAACFDAGIEFVAGTEITATRENIDVHTLGYFIDIESQKLAAFLTEQRLRRIERVREIVHRLGKFGIALDADAILQSGLDDQSRAVGRPWIARALVAAGHVATSDEAFSRWLSRGRPAFVPRMAAAPEEVIGRIHEAHGIASIAHPGLLGRDGWLPQLAEAGLDAIEAYHCDHDAQTTRLYLDLATRLGVAVSGGSDYHADESHGGASIGSVSLPRDAYERLVTLAGKLKT